MIEGRSQSSARGRLRPHARIPVGRRASLLAWFAVAATGFFACVAGGADDGGEIGGTTVSDAGGGILAIDGGLYPDVKPGTIFDATDDAPCSPGSTAKCKTTCGPSVRSSACRASGARARPWWAIPRASTAPARATASSTRGSRTRTGTATATSSPPSRPALRPAAGWARATTATTASRASTPAPPRSAIASTTTATARSTRASTSGSSIPSSPRSPRATRPTTPRASKAPPRGARPSRPATTGATGRWEWVSNGFFVCISGGTALSGFSDVVAAQPGCSSDALAGQRVCESAVHRAGAAKGFASAILQSHAPSSWTYLGLPNDRVKVFAGVSWTEITRSTRAARSPMLTRAGLQRRGASLVHRQGLPEAATGPIQYNPSARRRLREGLIAPVHGRAASLRARAGW